jgi:hypothetical protein
MILSKARSLKGKIYGISPELPKEIVDRRKKVIPRLIDAKKEGKSAYFSRAEPDNLYIDDKYIIFWFIFPALRV